MSRFARNGNPRGLIVVGLGNPGSKYANTRHNLGADVISALATRYGERLRDDAKTSAAITEIRIGEHRVVAAIPMTFMNESGQAVAALLRRYDIPDLGHLVVVHDELDLPAGRVKLKSGGGLAGHNGLRSIRSHIGSDEFTRIRMGVDKPPGGARQGADWVLSKISSATRDIFDIACQRACDAVELIVAGGVQHAMAEINTRQEQ